MTRRFGAVPALDQVSLIIQRGEFFSLLGPSGCGKTTLLRLIAGLDLPDAGALKIGGVDALPIPAHRRPVNTVFQSYALFPHLTVRENVAFGLRMKRVPDSELAGRVTAAMTLVQISELAERRPAQLSGGQKQRVALARALINEPEVLLLDEPLGALDLKLRRQLQIELHQLQQRLGITFIYVTHDQDEALVMSDRIAVMNAGRIEQLGVAGEIYERPRTRFVAQFLGSCNLIEGTPLRPEPNGFECETALGRLRIATVEGPAVGSPAGQGSRITLAIRPEKIHLLTNGEQPDGNRVGGRIEGLIYRGAETQYQVRIGGQRLHVVALNNRSGRSSFSVGDLVQCCLPGECLIPLDD